MTSLVVFCFVLLGSVSPVMSLSAVTSGAAF